MDQNMTDEQRRLNHYAKEIALDCGYIDPKRQHWIAAGAAIVVADEEIRLAKAEALRSAAVSLRPPARYYDPEVWDTADWLEDRADEIAPLPVEEAGEVER